MMLLKMIATGRDWGDKVPPKLTKVTLSGVPCVISEDDMWEGPIEAGQRGQYYRMHVLATERAIRDDRIAS